MLNLDASSIKNEARYYLSKNKKTMILTGMLISVMTAIPSIFSNTKYAVVAGVLYILFATLPHGYATASLKMISGKEQQVSVSGDGLVGFRRFAELFPTYILAGILEYLPIIVVAMISFIYLGTAMSFVGISMGMIVLVIIFFIAAIIYIIYLTICLSFVGFVIETKGLHGWTAISTSYHMVNGHVSELLAFYLKYIFWVALTAIIYFSLNGVLTKYIGPAGNLLTIVLGAFVESYFYRSEYTIGVAIFYMRLYNHEMGLDQINDQVINGEAVKEEE